MGLDILIVCFEFLLSIPRPGCDFEGSSLAAEGTKALTILFDDAEVGGLVVDLFVMARRQGVLEARAEFHQVQVGDDRVLREQRVQLLLDLDIRLLLHYNIRTNYSYLTS